MSGSLLAHEEPFQLVDIPDQEFDTAGADEICDIIGARSQNVSVRMDDAANFVPMLESVDEHVTNAISHIGECEMSDLASRNAYEQSVHTDVRRAEHNRNISTGYLGDIDHCPNDEIERHARLVLIRMKYAESAVRCAPPEIYLPSVVLTQLIIDRHVAVVTEMIRIKQIEPSPQIIIAYICGSFEQSDVSSLAGHEFLSLKYSDQVMAVLSIARAIVVPLWSDYDDCVYTECHKQLDRQALFYIQAMYHRRGFAAECCVIS